jgi:Tripartite tricarboxylate transporter TctB family
MIVRTDHIAGGVFAALGLGVLALSGDLPTGSLSFPGAGMMPKLIAILLTLFSLMLVMRAKDSAPLANIAWDDLPHAARVIAITAVAVALYQTLGFVITMALLLFALTFAVERRPAASAALFSLGVVALTWLLFKLALRTPLEPGTFGF